MRIETANGVMHRIDVEDPLLAEALARPGVYEVMKLRSGYPMVPLTITTATSDRSTELTQWQVMEAFEGPRGDRAG